MKYKQIGSNLVILFLKINVLFGISDLDSNGYIVYCPCMGRFGNQAEQLLGSLQFAKSLNRTLVLPPFIEYNKFGANLIPFSNYIQVEPIKNFQRVITMENFMEDVAPILWQEDQRIIMCYMARTGSMQADCNPFEGSPFGPFWHHFNVTRFNQSLFHSPLLTDKLYADQWKQKFGHIKVLAFVGAPSSFPTNENALSIQQFINFAPTVVEDALQYREKRNFLRTPYIALHLRHGSDWLRACELLKEKPGLTQLFASQQCTKSQKFRYLPYMICNPTLDIIVDQIETILKSSSNEIKVVYIATDNDNETLWQKMYSRLSKVVLITPSKTFSKEITYHVPPTPIIDAYLMTYANYFIGNCISSFSGFVSRLRTFNLHFNHSTAFFAENLIDNELIRDEL